MIEWRLVEYLQNIQQSMYIEVRSRERGLDSHPGGAGADPRRDPCGQNVGAPAPVAYCV